MRIIAAALLLSLATASSPASSIAGRVIAAESGRPLPRILVTLASSDPAQQVEVLTDEDGRFQFTDVPPGRYAVSAASGEHRSTWLRQWFGDTKPTGPWGSPRRYPIDVTDGGSRADVEIPLMRALGIEGQVIAPWEEGLANVPVVAITADGERATPNAFFTDDLGHYRLFGLAPGRYRVCADARFRINGEDIERQVPPFVRTCHPASIAEGTAADVSLVSSDATGIDIRLQRTTGRTITGSVTDASGAPAKGAYVSATSVDFLKGSSSYVRSRDGTFTISGLLPGEYQVHAALGGRRFDDSKVGAPEVGAAQVDVTAVDASAVELTLSKPIKLSGRIRFDGPPPAPARLSRVLVRAWWPDSHTMLLSDPPTAILREDMSFEIPDVHRLATLIQVQGLPAGWGVARVRYQERDVTYQPTDFGAAAAPIEITLTSRLTELRVTVTSESGTPVDDGDVIALPRTARVPYGSVTARRSPDGAMILGPLVPGEYLVAAITRADSHAVIEDPSRLAALDGIGTKVTVDGERQRSIELHLVALPEKR